MIAMTYNPEQEDIGPDLPETTLIEGAVWWVGDDDWPRVWGWLNRHLGTRKTGLWYRFVRPRGIACWSLSIATTPTSLRSGGGGGEVP